MMKKTMKKAICTLLTSAMLVSALAGCGDTSTNSKGSESTANTSESVQTSTSESVATQPTDEKVNYDVTLTWLTMGKDAPDRQQIVEKANEILKEELGVTLKVEYVADAEAHSLALATGKNYDIVISDGWLNYEVHANNGAFAELTDEELQKYAPDIWAAGLESDILDATKVAGKRYAVGRLQAMDMTAFAYRGDLADKYGVGTIESFEDFEKYMYAIAENEKDMLAWDLPGSRWWEMPGVWFTAQGWVSIGTLGFAMPAYIDHFEGDNKVFLVSEQPEYLEYVTKMNEWYKAGIFSKSILSNSTATKDSFLAGRSGVVRLTSAGQMQQLWDEVQVDERKDWDIRFWACYDNYWYKSSAHRSSAVSAFSKNKEAALAVMNLMYSNEELYDVINYGIEGLHYNVDEEGRYLAITDESFGNWYGMMKNPDLEKETTVFNFPDYEKVKAHYEEAYLNNACIACVIDTSKFDTIITKVNEARDQYMSIAAIGAFAETPEEIVAAEIAAYKAAGIDEYIKQYQEQLNAHVENLK